MVTSPWLALRIGGVRPACYVDCSMLDKVTGTGTKDDPYVFSIVP